MREIKLSFWSGVAASTFYSAFWQDFLGKEKWVDITQTFWVNTPYWVWPIALVVVFLLDIGAQHLERLRWLKTLQRPQARCEKCNNDENPT